MINISFDAMGGDYAPYEIVKGAFEAAHQFKLRVFLVGKKTDIDHAIERILSNKHKDDTKLIDFIKNQNIDYYDSATLINEFGLKSDASSQSLSQCVIVDAPEEIDMGEKNPAKAIRSAPNSSMAISNKLVSEAIADAVISAGNTGAATAASLFELKRIKGFERPCIASLIPTHKSKMLLVDAGSNIDTSPKQMLQNAIIGSCMAQVILKRDNPRVGLLNVGGEPGKGTTLYKESYELLERSSLNFIGNVEGKTIIDDNCDVAVCDGFSGNIHLKALEGGLKMMSEAFKRELKASSMGKIAGLLFKLTGGIDRIKAHFDPSEFGGALLGGLKHISLISHGSSNAEAMRNAAKHAKLLVENKIIEKLEEQV